VHTIRVLIINVLLGGLTVLGAGVAFRVDGLWCKPLPGALMIVAWPLLAAGAILIVAAAYTLVKHSGATGAPGDPTLKLVTTGPYGWIRNPIYAGDALLLIGVAFLARSPTFLAVSFAFPPCIDLFVRSVEEPRAERRFGERYVDYKRDVPRWIPRLGPSGSRRARC
jgi:protein-S-isoprenylcysteine O-methyltransferase Ste14